MRKLIVMLCALLMIYSVACIQEGNYKTPELCKNNWKANISLADLQSFYKGETIKNQEDWVIEAYVISSDRAGNFFGSLHVQDHPNNPDTGFEVLIDLPDTHLFFPPGHGIIIRLKGLYLGKNNGNYQLGGVYSFFEQQKVGRLPGNLIEKHLKLSCDKSVTVVPKAISLNGLKNEKPSTYVEVDSVQFPEDLVGKPFAEPKQETIRQLEDCYGNTIEILNSGYADFASSLLPGGRGTITGVLSKNGEKLRMLLNELSELRFTYQRCPPGPDPISSDSLFISEIADPDNNSEARFIELFNAGDDEIPLLGWKLERFTNDNQELGSQIDLSELSISAKGSIVIASNAIRFEEVFGFPPDLEGGKNSPADSNGDDNLVLRDPFGVVMDIFGRIGEDGSGTDHEFEDGKAFRRLSVYKANAIYDPAEWILYNDSGIAGTLNQPQLAPEDFNPGKR